MIYKDLAPEIISAGNIGVIEIFHADSLTGPMSKLKAAYEVKNEKASINLSSGTSKQLAERLLKGDVCDVFASSSPMVIDDLMKEKLVDSDQAAASWYVIFSANEMVVIVEKGNALGIRHVEDLARPDVSFVRVTGDKDLATSRTIEFLNRAADAARETRRSCRRAYAAETLPTTITIQTSLRIRGVGVVPNLGHGLRS
jgi:ABC-type molybdate transport system substrate-binding protein